MEGKKSTSTPREYYFSYKGKGCQRGSTKIKRAHQLMPRLSTTLTNLIYVLFLVLFQSFVYVVGCLGHNQTIGVVPNDVAERRCRRMPLCFLKVPIVFQINNYINKIKPCVIAAVISPFRLCYWISRHQTVRLFTSFAFVAFVSDELNSIQKKGNS